MLPVFVLMHSPLVGPATWRPVAEVLRSRGADVRIPSLVDVTVDGPPYWPRVTSAVRACVTDRDVGRAVVLVAHSNAGVFVPATVVGLSRHVRAAVFVDASLPAHTGETPMAPDSILGFLTGLADEDELLPRWTDWFGADEVASLFPDDATRRAVGAEQPRLPLSYFHERVPVPSGWDTIHCSYIVYSEGYEPPAAEAGQRGWPVVRLPGQHLHQLVDPPTVAEALLRLALGADD